MAWHRIERAALVHALTQAGPGASTRCAGWETQHLAAHVVLRERNPALSAGIGIPRLAARTEQAVQALGARSTSPQGYTSLVADVTAGPSRLSPMSWLGDAGNLLELYVHTEDVRRGGPGGASIEPRVRQADHDEAMWRWLARSARLMYRHSPVGVLLATDSGHEVRAAHAPTGQTAQDVVVRGPVGELVLHAFGRGEVAHVTVDGPPEAITRLDLFRPR